MVLTAGAGAISSVLEESYHLATMDGVERRHPFYDVRVLDYCLSLPVDQKLHDGWTRSILRRSLRDALPALVRDRTDKGNLSPHFFQSLRRASMPSLGRLLNEDWSYLRTFVNRSALERDYEKIGRVSPSDSNMKLWYGLVLATWVKRIHGAPKARAP